MTMTMAGGGGGGDPEPGTYIYIYIHISGAHVPMSRHTSVSCISSFQSHCGDQCLTGHCGIDRGMTES